MTSRLPTPVSIEKVLGLLPGQSLPCANSRQAVNLAYRANQQLARAAGVTTNGFRHQYFSFKDLNGISRIKRAVI